MTKRIMKSHTFLSDYDYNLPDERIAKNPPVERGTSNLLVFNRKTGEIEHKKYFNIIDYIKKGDAVVINKTKVENIRTYFNVPRNGKRVEVLFLERIEDFEEKVSGREYWYCLIGRAKSVEIGDELFNEDGVGLPITVLQRKGDGFVVSCERGNMALIFEKAGHVPLPPYMKREDKAEDVERYNTVFSKIPGSSASPTASLNLTEEMLDKLREKGVKIIEIELRVGWGTFAPIRTENIEDHQIHSEYIEVGDDQEDEINEVIENGGEIWAFGTTVARTLESVAKKEDGKWVVDDYEGYTNLYIHPGYEWRVVDHLITNFHAPKSSLIVLVAAFAGYEETMKLYEQALDSEYNFLSYGDSMLII